LQLVAKFSGAFPNKLLTPKNTVRYRFEQSIVQPFAQANTPFHPQQKGR
jgi:hypothetical protein